MIRVDALTPCVRSLRWKWSESAHLFDDEGDFEALHGKFALCADLLTEIGPGGFFRDSFSALDRSKFAAVAVITSDELAEIAIQE